MAKKEKPLVSIMMATYNHARFIEQALDSCLNQETSFAFEIIVCDDFSQDGTRDIVMRKASEHDNIVLSFQERNSKFGKNFIDGLSKARGTYLAFCEGDDYWSVPYKLEKQVRFLEENPDFSVSAHRVEMFFQDGSRSEKTQHIYKDCNYDEERIKNGIFYADEAIANYYFQTGSLVLRSRFKDGLPSWFRQRMLFDHFFFMLHAVEGKIKYFDEVMSIWRRHENGYSWLQTQNKGLFFQKEGSDWIKLYSEMDKFFSYRFTHQIRERILLALRGLAENCLQTNSIDQLQKIIINNEKLLVATVLPNLSLLDAIRLAFPEDVKVTPPWTSPKVPASKAPAPSIGGGYALDLAAIPLPTQKSVWDTWTQGKEVACFSCPKAALFTYFWNKGVTTVWFPIYMNPQVEDLRLKLQLKAKYYAVDEQLNPRIDFLAHLVPGEGVLTVCYFGKKTNAKLQKNLAERSDIFWLEDRSHALWPGSSKADAALYSPSQILGVSDGGIVVGEDVASLENSLCAKNFESLYERQKNLLNQYEQKSITINHTLADSKEKQQTNLSMGKASQLTLDFLQRLPLTPIANKRKQNWEILYSHLGKYCLWSIPKPSFAPYAFPFLCPEHIEASIFLTILASKNIFCERIWFPVMGDKKICPIEFSLSQRLIALPCNHQSSAEEMERIVFEITQILDGKLDLCNF